MTAVAFGIAPALRLAGTSPVEALRQQSRSATGHAGLARLRGALAAAQVALALTLLAGAGVLLASFHGLQRVDLGVRVDGVLTFEVNLPTSRYDETRRASFQEELASRLETIPGVTAAGGISRLPATGSYHPWNTQIRSGPLAGTPLDRSRFAMQQRVVSGDLFAAFGIPVLAGRSFDARDDANAPGRAVVSANFARHGVSRSAARKRASASGSPLAAGSSRSSASSGDVALDVYGAPTMVVYHAHRQFAGNRNWSLTQVVAAERIAGGAARCRAQRGGATRSGAGGLPAGADGRCRRSRHEPGAIRARAHGGVRARRACACRARPLRRARVRGAPALDGDWHPHRARGERRTGTRARRPPGRGRRQPRHRSRALRAPAAWTLARGTRVRDRAVGSSNPDRPVPSCFRLVALVAAWLPAQRATRVEPRIAMQEGH